MTTGYETFVDAEDIDADVAQRLMMLVNALGAVLTRAQRQGPGTYTLSIVVEEGGAVGFSLRKTD